MDKYDEAVLHLTAREQAEPGSIRRAWLHFRTDHDGCLFAMATKSGDNVAPDDGARFGCLTMIRFGRTTTSTYANQAATPELTAAIRADERIPADSISIKITDLPTFAEWQRRLDKELGRV